jgi:hypothetical protein
MKNLILISLAVFIISSCVQNKKKQERSIDPYEACPLGIPPKTIKLKLNLNHPPHEDFELLFSSYSEMNLIKCPGSKACKFTRDNESNTLSVEIFGYYQINPKDFSFIYSEQGVEIFNLKNQSAKKIEIQRRDCRDFQPDQFTYEITE